MARARGLLPERSLVMKLVTADGKEMPIARLLELDPDNLIAEYEMQAPWTAVLQAEYGKCELAIERKERHIKELEARAFIRVRDRLRLGTKVPNEATIKANVVVDQEVRDAYQELFQLREAMIAINSARLAFNVRKDMLVSMGAEVRQDKKSY